MMVFVLEGHGLFIPQIKSGNTRCKVLDYIS